MPRVATTFSPPRRRGMVPRFFALRVTRDPIGRGHRLNPVPPISRMPCFFFNDTATTEIYTLSLHDALPIFPVDGHGVAVLVPFGAPLVGGVLDGPDREDLADASVRHDLVTRAQARHGPEFLGLARHLRPVAVVGVRGGKRVAEVLLALEKREVADLVPAHADVDRKSVV